MFQSPSPLAYPNGYTVQQPSPNPQEFEMLMRRKWKENSQPIVSDPYMDYVQEMNSCSSTIKEKILSDKEYVDVDFYCENLIKQALYEQIIPQIIGTQQGRIAFERLLQTTRALKQKYTQEEVTIQQNFQRLMEDDVVKNRMIELQNENLRHEKVVNSQPQENPSVGGNQQ